MADFLDEKRKEIQARLKELKPLVEEYQLLQAADQALGGLGNGAAAPAATRPPHPPPRRRGAARAPRHRRQARPAQGRRHARRRRRWTSSRDRPGITIPELAEAMGIQQNYLYRVMPGLAEEGKVTKSGRGWHLRERRRERAPAGHLVTTRPSLATASRSSWSSSTVLSMRSRENSGTSRPWTISHSPPRCVTGNEVMIPSGTP